MKKILFFFLFLFAFCAFAASAHATDIDIGASQIVGFNSANIGNDTPLSNVSVTLDSPSVTCSSCLPAGAVGIGGMQVTLAGVRYEIASVASRSACTLTANYAASSGTVSGTLHKFAHLRIYVTSSFTPFGSTTVVQSGAVGTSAWYRRYGVSVVNDGAQNIAYIPAINNLPATTDSNNPTAAYTARIYTAGGGLIQAYPQCVSAWKLDHLTSLTSWAQICQFNSPPNPPPPQPVNYLTEAQINNRFPTCALNNLDYYAATGNVKSCLALSAEFQIAGGVLSLAETSNYNRIQEEGSNLVQRRTMNFIGSSATAADDAGNTRTNVTFDADLNAISNLTGTGFAQRTGADTWALNANVVTGPASATDNAIARFDLTTGKIIQNSAVTVADTTGNFAVPTGWTFTNASGSSFAINSDNFLLTTAASSLPGVQPFRLVTGAQTQSSGNPVILGIVPTYNQTGTAASDDLVFARNETALGSGQHNFIRGLGGAAGSTVRFRINNLGNYFFGASGGFIGDENGNEYLSFSTSASAVNNLDVGNAATGFKPFIRALGGDATIDIELAPKGTGRVFATGSGAIELFSATPNLVFNDTDNVKNTNIVLNNDAWSFNNNTGSFEMMRFNLSTNVATFNAIPVLPASDPTTDNQATRRKFVTDSTTPFSIAFSIADSATYPLAAFGVPEWVVPPNTAIIATQCELTYNAGSASGSFTVIVRKRTAGTSTQTDICTFSITSSLAVFGRTTTTSSPLPFTLTAGDSVYVIMTTRSSPLQQGITVSIMGTNKRL